MFLGLNADREPVHLDSSDLLTHGVILGRTGSGKSGLTIALIEEAAEDGSSVVVFDPKGDLTNLKLPLVEEREFSEWVEAGDTAGEAYQRMVAGLEEHQLTPEDVRRWRDKVEVRIYAPGKTYGGGRALNVFPDFDLPISGISRESASRAVTTVLQAINEAKDPFDPAIIYMTEAVMVAWEADYMLPIYLWPKVLTQPPVYLQDFGGMPVEDFFPKRKRSSLARKLIGFQHHAERWTKGVTLDLNQLVIQEKPQVAVFTMRHLPEEERHFFVSMMMQKLVDFMFQTDASKRLKLLVVLDEARGYLPPHPYNPPTKQPLCTILAQGRAQGIGMLIGTQSPMDLDYKALGNVGTWFVGRLRERDCVRDLAAELRDRDVKMEELQNLPLRRFMFLDKRGGQQLLNTRWCYNFLRGPLNSEELTRFDTDKRGIIQKFPG